MSEPRRAATVMVLRPTADGRDVEVLFVRRNARASFMANAYVFPGGRVDDADAEGGPELASQRCAARELCEEAGLTVADPGELVYFARWVTPSAEPKRFDADFFLSLAKLRALRRLWARVLEVLEGRDLSLVPSTVSDVFDATFVLASGGVDSVLAAAVAPGSRGKPVQRAVGSQLPSASVQGVRSRPEADSSQGSCLWICE